MQVLTLAVLPYPHLNDYQVERAVEAGVRPSQWTFSDASESSFIAPASDASTELFDATSPLCSLIGQCWATEPTMRPGTTDILARLREIIRSQSAHVPPISSVLVSLESATSTVSGAVGASSTSSSSTIVSAQAGSVASTTDTLDGSLASGDGVSRSSSTLPITVHDIVAEKSSLGAATVHHQPRQLQALAGAAAELIRTVKNVGVDFQPTLRAKRTNALFITFVFRSPMNEMMQLWVATLL